MAVLSCSRASTRLLLAVALVSTSRAQTNSSPPPAIGLFEFQGLLFTEVDDEVAIIQTEVSKETVVAQVEGSPAHRHLKRKTERGRFRKADDVPPAANTHWDHLVTHGWSMAEIVVKTDSNGNNRRGLGARHLIEAGSDGVCSNQAAPFLVCNRNTDLQSGNQRIQPMLLRTGSVSPDVVVVANTQNQTCFFVSVTGGNALDVALNENTDNYAVVPITDMMKISMGTIDDVNDDGWTIPTPATRRLMTDETGADWERLIRVSVAPGLGITDEFSLLEAAHEILDDVKAMANEGSRRRRRLAENALQEETNTADDLYLSDGTMSVADAFSMTSQLVPKSKDVRRHLAEEYSSRSEFWARALTQGIESHHQCKTMFSELDMRMHIEVPGFDIVLNPNSDKYKAARSDEEIASSASNANCVTSLIMALSVHPNILNVEASAPITPDDKEGQWITQSNTEGSRPLFDVGLTGSGQIVSVSDSGIDQANTYFAPASSANLGAWSTNERKVVKVDSSGGGDYFEEAAGHGTRVAGIIAGSTASGETDSDGVAPGAKIHMYDIKVGTLGSYADPSPTAMFDSFYNNGQGAKITNGSWSAAYRPYSYRCILYDTTLGMDNYRNILYVASTGNEGNDFATAERTVGDPASCKNVLSVGANESAGSRLRSGDLGRTYLAEFSSRGPTADQRTKPELVAPGYYVSAPQANGATMETLGTSFAAPVVAGSAALIRQYFEQGWNPCGSAGCGRGFSPSGPLIKAVLINGSQFLVGVQKTGGGPVLGSVTPYDSNQGAGVINLLKSVPISGKNQMNIAVVNDRSISNGAVDKLVLSARTSSCSETQISATLTWYDPAGTTGCAKCLINDLDLFIDTVDTSGNPIGNRSYPNGLGGKDSTNNFERIQVSVQNGARYRLSVMATNLATSSQKYSLVVTGCFVVKQASSGMLCG